MPWQLQEAKQKFSELVRRAQDEGPQFVTRHGEEVAVVVSAKTFRELNSSSDGDFKAFLLSAPDLTELDIERDTDLGRTVDL